MLNSFFFFQPDIETIVKFALLEFKYGEPQRGQTMFESILNNYPKRSDLWSVYLDAMIKLRDVELVRYAYEICSPLRKKKSLIKSGPFS